jgi:hypothetical protein
MKLALLLLPLLSFSVCGDEPASRSGELAAGPVVTRGDGTVTVKFGDSEFTTLHYKGFAKPVLHPIMGPTGINLVREWPVKETAGPGEEKDHPHHKGLWFTHGAVNGVDFWAENDKAGKIIVTAEPKVTQTGSTATIATEESWKAPGDRVVCTSATTITCGLDGSDRFLDYAITIKAGETDVTFGDTKEGTMGIRSHPALNLKGKVATGHAVNSEGAKDASIWGKSARWVDYSGTVDGKAVGIACLDHPSNLRHPTTWHARDYGLIAANPFGLHDFGKKPAGAGDYTIKKGDSLTLRYRWLFHTGDTATAKIEERWKKWAGK